jgi:outer membrane protein assembly factor BamE (lipoprotein component of BamABCDE complex)
MKMRIVVVMLCLSLVTGCMSATQHRSNVGIDDGSSDTLTVGKVQKEIRVGMSGSEVALVLGSPNLVTTDEERREVWVYDKVATETVASTSTGWAFALIVGGSSGSGASTRTQRTLTVVVKFDSSGHVRDFAYHSSKF